MSTHSIADEIQTLAGKFQHACRQVVLLNDRVNDAQVRFDRSATEDQRSFRYCLRLRLMILEGVRNTYYEYATRCATSMDNLHQDLLEAHYYGTPTDDDEGEYYDSDVAMSEEWIVVFRTADLTRVTKTNGSLQSQTSSQWNTITKQCYSPLSIHLGHGVSVVFFFMFFFLTFLSLRSPSTVSSSFYILLLSSIILLFFPYLF